MVSLSNHDDESMAYDTLRQAQGDTLYISFSIFFKTGTCQAFKITHIVISLGELTID